MIGRLGLRLTLAFVAVVLLAVAAVFVIGALSINVDVDTLAQRQQADLTRAAAVAAEVAYGHDGWKGAHLAPVTDLVAGAGGD